MKDAYQSDSWIGRRNLRDNDQFAVITAKEILPNYILPLSSAYNVRIFEERDKLLLQLSNGPPVLMRCQATKSFYSNLFSNLMSNGTFLLVQAQNKQNDLRPHRVLRMLENQTSFHQPRSINNWFCEIYSNNRFIACYFSWWISRSLSQLHNFSFFSFLATRIFCDC